MSRFLCFSFLAVLILVLLLALVPCMAQAQDAQWSAVSAGEPPGSPLMWQVVNYGLGVLLSIGAIAKIRDKAAKAGKEWADSGRLASMLTYVAAAIYLLLSSRFDCLNDIQAWLQQVAILGSGTTVTYAAGKSVLKEVLGVLDDVRILRAVLVMFLVSGLACTPSAYAADAPAALTQTLVLAPAPIDVPALSAVAAEPEAPASLLGDTTSFSVAYAKSLKNDEDGLIGQLSVTVVRAQLAPDLKISASVDLNAVPFDGKTKFGLGGSIGLEANGIGLGIGVAYLPEPYGWSATIRAVQLFGD